MADWVTRRDAAAHVEANLPGVVSHALPARTVTHESAGKRPAIGAGVSLDRETRARFEPIFGHKFSDVRVHADADADRSARSFGAMAYTLGRDIVFRRGQFAPHTADGRRLLAHELTHVLQQRSATVSPAVPQLKAAATRFQDEPTLDAVSDGKAVLQEGNIGEAVIRVSTALSELSYYPVSIIDEHFAPALTSAVTSYQTAKGLFGKVQNGKVDKPTFDKLDQDFSMGFVVERGVLARQKSATIPSETKSLDPVERAASARAVSTEAPVNPVTGRPPDFHPDIPGKGNYGTRLRDIVEQEIKDEWNAMGKGKTAAHSTAGALYDAPTVDAIAVESQTAVNAVFGEYIKGKAVAPLQMGVSLGDAWKKKEDTLTAGGKAEEDTAVGWRVQKILDGDNNVKSLDREHGAIQTRKPEQAIIGPIKADLMKKYRSELLELHKAWPGFAQSGVVYVQLFKGATSDDQRRERWEFYQTFIHEYIHTLENSDHVNYRKTLDAQKGGFTLREGATDYFTKIVWSSIAITDALRAKIEGPVHDPKVKTVIPPLNTYPEAENAERLAGVVGIRNLAAAFFLGKVELIGSKP